MAWCSAGTMGFAAGISGSRHRKENPQRWETVDWDIEFSQLVPELDQAQVLCKAGLGFTWQSTWLSAPWKGMTWPEGHWGQWTVFLFFWVWVQLIPDCEYTNNLYVSLHSDTAVCFIMVAEFLEVLLHFSPALFGAGKPLKICCLILLI